MGHDYGWKHQLYIPFIFVRFLRFWCVSTSVKDYFSKSLVWDPCDRRRTLRRFRPHCGVTTRKTGTTLISSIVFLYYNWQCLHLSTGCRFAWGREMTINVNGCGIYTFSDWGSNSACASCAKLYFRSMSENGVPLPAALQNVQLIQGYSHAVSKYNFLRKDITFMLPCNG